MTKLTKAQYVKLGKQAQAVFELVRLSREIKDELLDIKLTLAENHFDKDMYNAIANAVCSTMPELDVWGVINRLFANLEKGNNNKP